MRTKWPSGTRALLLTWLWSLVSNPAEAATEPGRPARTGRPARAAQPAQIVQASRPKLPPIRPRLPGRGQGHVHVQGQGVATRPRPPRHGPVELYAPLHNERLLFRPFDERGRPRKNARRELSHFLRCPHTGRERPVDARLVPVLYRMGRHFGKQVVIYSGYRPPQLSTRPRSRHLSAAAIDFHIPGVKNIEVVRWLQQEFHPLGIGFYPDGVHVHLDVDRTVDAYWVKRGSDAVPLSRRLSQRGKPGPGKG